MGMKVPGLVLSNSLAHNPGIWMLHQAEDSMHQWAHALVGMDGIPQAWSCAMGWHGGCGDTCRWAKVGHQSLNLMMAFCH